MENSARRGAAWHTLALGPVQARATARKWGLARVRAALTTSLMGVYLCLSSAAASPRGVQHEIRARDLAVLLPTDDPSLVLGLAELGFGSDWYSSLERAFEQTSVGPALKVENRYDDWRLVSARFAPCQSLFDRPHPLAARLCWPEVRLVVQPIVREVEAAGRQWPIFADDRAAHMTFDYIAPQRQKPAQQVTRLKAGLATVREGNEPVDAALMEQLRLFEAERDRHTLDLLERVLALRAAGAVPTDYDRVDLRPEYAQSEPIKRLFRTRLADFLAQVRSQALLPREVTAFSLPEGREPALLDDWVFLRFEPRSSEVLVTTDIVVRSVRDESLLARIPGSTGLRVTMVRDDDAVYEAAGSRAGSPAEDEFRKNMILFVPDFAQNRERISDGRQVRVANTTCGSCHKLGPLRFDLHSLSYLQGEPISISPRVRRDVDLDLAWMASWVPSGSVP